MQANTDQRSFSAICRADLGHTHQTVLSAVQVARSRIEISAMRPSAYRVEFKIDPADEDAVVLGNSGKRIDKAQALRYRTAIAAVLAARDLEPVRCPFDHRKLRRCIGFFGDSVFRAKRLLVEEVPRPAPPDRQGQSPSSDWIDTDVRHRDGRRGRITGIFEGFDFVDLTITSAGNREIQDRLRLYTSGVWEGDDGWQWWSANPQPGGQWHDMKRGQ